MGGSALCAGLGICSSVFWAIRSIFVSERANRSRKRVNHSHHSFVMSGLSKSLTVALLSWDELPELIAHSHSFFKSDRNESLKSLFKKEQMSKERWEQKKKNVKNVLKIRMFWVISEWLAWIMRKSLTLLFFKEPIANERSFVKSNVSKLLTVAF